MPKKSPKKTCEDIINANLEKLVDVAEERGECKQMLQKIADKNKCAVLAFIAPYMPIRVSPVESHSASIGLSEEFAMVTAIERIKRKKIESLYILINTPGGYVHSSYKIAKMLRSSFKTVKAFVPHMAASGGSLMVLAANESVMGPMSNLTPIDAQVGYNGEMVSSYGMVKALSRLTEFFAKITADEAPYPWRVMADKLDPIFMEEWSSFLHEMQIYATELMRLSGYKPEERTAIIERLILTQMPHSFVIDKTRAEKMGIKLSTSRADFEILKTMKAWLTGYMLTGSEKHIIRYLVPQQKPDTKNAKKKKHKAS